jgi:hypothetical protein
LNVGRINHRRLVGQIVDGSPVPDIFVGVELLPSLAANRYVVGSHLTTSLVENALVFGFRWLVAGRAINEEFLHHGFVFLSLLGNAEATCAIVADGGGSH